MGFGPLLPTHNSVPAPRHPAGACLWSITSHFTIDTSRKGSSGIPHGRPVETQGRYASSPRKEAYLPGKPLPHSRKEGREEQVKSS